MKRILQHNRVEINEIENPESRFHKDFHKCKFIDPVLWITLVEVLPYIKFTQKIIVIMPLKLIEELSNEI